MFKNILVAVDGSENSDMAVETAVEFTSPRALWVEERWSHHKWMTHLWI